MTYYPELSDQSFREKLMGLEEFQELKMPALSPINTLVAFEQQVNQVCTGYEKFLYQQFLAQYLSNRSPYKSILLFHSLGVGKTCSAITLAESLMDSYSMREHEPRIWIVTKESLRGSFQDQIFDIMKLVNPDDVYSQCTADKYARVLFTATNKSFDRKKYSEDAEYRESMKDTINKSMFEYINRRYKFVSYGEFGRIIADKIKNKKLKEFARDKTIIIDEAHNLINTEDSTRISEEGDVSSYVHAEGEGAESAEGSETEISSDDLEKELNEIKNETEVAIDLKTKAATADYIAQFLRAGTNIRLILMSATPMYDKPFELFWLLSLLLINDKREGEISKFAKMTDKFPNLRFNTITQENIDRVLQILKPLSREYISYIRGRSPFAFAPKISMKDKTIRPKNVSIRMVTSPEYSSIEDGIVASPISDLMKGVLAKISEIHEGNRPLAVAQRRIANHIVFTDGTPDDTGPFIGENGFLRVLQKTDGGQYTYNPAFNKYFDPAGRLAEAAPKIKKICDLIANSEGVVVVYSEFIYGGLIPTAVALEHMGYRRFIPAPAPGAADESIAKESILVQPARQNGLKYAILTTGDFMKGAGNKNNILKVLKGDENIDGEQIKVVLISQVAGEGITIPYVREMHILTPWYHMNLIDQVVGRGIRTCSHIKLPIQKRNVTVFLHALFNPDEETEDLKTYLIAANKKAISERMISSIRDNALDCYLMQNVNYFARDLFKFGQVAMTTSQQRRYNHLFGDDKTVEPKCDAPLVRMDRSINVRYEVYSPLVEIAIQRIRKYILSRTPTIFFRTEDLVAAMGPTWPDHIRAMALKKAMIPNILFKNTSLNAYDNGFILQKPEKALDNIYINLFPVEDTFKKVPVEKIINESIQGHFISEHININIVSVYETLLETMSGNKSEKEKIFKQIMKLFIMNNLAETHSKLKQVFDILDDEGVFIHQKEDSVLGTKDRSDKVIGYFDIFNTDYANTRIVRFDRQGNEVITNVSLGANGNFPQDITLLKNRTHYKISDILARKEFCIIYNRKISGKSSGYKPYTNFLIVRTNIPKFESQTLVGCYKNINNVGASMITADKKRLIATFNETNLKTKNPEIVERFLEYDKKYSNKKSILYSHFINYMLNNARDQICFAPFFKPKK